MLQTRCALTPWPSPWWLCNLKGQGLYLKTVFWWLQGGLQPHRLPKHNGNECWVSVQGRQHHIRELPSPSRLLGLRSGHLH